MYNTGGAFGCGSLHPLEPATNTTRLVAPDGTGAAAARAPFSLPLCDIPLWPVLLLVSFLRSPPPPPRGSPGPNAVGRTPVARARRAVTTSTSLKGWCPSKASDSLSVVAFGCEVSAVAELVLFPALNTRSDLQRSASEGST